LKFLLTILFVFTFYLVFSQDFILNERYIQLTGLVLTADSQQPVLNASIRIRNTYRGVSANLQGFFSMVVKEGDWIDISSMGFKKQSIQVPLGLKEPSYVRIVALESDTIVFNIVNIYPWPSRAKFKEAFVTVKIDKTYQEILNENLSRLIRQMMVATLLPDGSEMQSRSMLDYSSQAANKGMVPTLGPTISIPFGSTKGYSSKKSDLPPLKW